MLEERSELNELSTTQTDHQYGGSEIQVLEGLEDYANGRPGWQTAPDNCEGLRISFPEEKGWFLLRMSLHDPLMPLNIESCRPGGTQAILDLLRPFLARWKELDLSRLP